MNTHTGIGKLRMKIIQVINRLLVAIQLATNLISFMICWNFQIWLSVTLKRKSAYYHIGNPMKNISIAIENVNFTLLVEYKIYEKLFIF